MEMGWLWLSGLMLVRVASLGGEQLAIHGLGKEKAGALPTMGIAFWGAAIVLWIFAAANGQVVWIGETMWTGALYALAFGLYTTALAEGPVGVVSPWTNATVLLLWFVAPTGGWMSILGISVFGFGAWFLLHRRVSRAVAFMVLADILLVFARMLDASNTDYPLYAYAASQFTAISLWMSVPILSTFRAGELVALVRKRPGWSALAGITNAFAYLTLFTLLHRLPPAVVEALSAFAGFFAVLASLVIFREPQGRRKVFASCLMTSGVLLLLFDHVG